NTTTARGRRSMNHWLISIFAVSLFFTPAVVPTLAAQTWSAQHARQWYSGQVWLVGSNFVPSTAINELEMWQADSFDLKTIDRELGWAQSLGMNTMRVFLHNLLWQQGSKEFLERMDNFYPLQTSTTSKSLLCSWIR